MPQTSSDENDDDNSSSTEASSLIRQRMMREESKDEEGCVSQLKAKIQKEVDSALFRSSPDNGSTTTRRKDRKKHNQVRRSETRPRRSRKSTTSPSPLEMPENLYSSTSSGLDAMPPLSDQESGAPILVAAELLPSTSTIAEVIPQGPPRRGDDSAITSRIQVLPGAVRMNPSETMRTARTMALSTPPPRPPHLRVNESQYDFVQIDEPLGRTPQQIYIDEENPISSDTPSQM